jgi:hypothetical protein
MTGVGLFRSAAGMRPADLDVSATLPPDATWSQSVAAAVCSARGSTAGEVALRRGFQGAAPFQRGVNGAIARSTGVMDHRGV